MQFEDAAKLALPIIRKMAFSMCRGDIWTSEEIIQLTLIKLWRGLKRIQPLKLEGWAYQTVKTTFIDFDRKRRNEYKYIAFSCELVDEADPSLWQHTAESQPSPDYSSYREMVQILEGLPPQDRRNLVAMLDGEPYTVLAKRWNVPVGTVRSRLGYTRRRARALLRDYACASLIFILTLQPVLADTVYELKPAIGAVKTRWRDRHPIAWKFLTFPHKVVVMADPWIGAVGGMAQIGSYFKH